ncbi:hypothetical protein KLA_15755 [Cellulophaga geojensis KL-A]|uniref:SMI1/KNR4 family protein n=1 Tax=Cellulophaga geojensis KL-A TaxID=1328323 RepID=A0ABN0RK49_9FLAO|nr:hypothetical protein [Cellulophaga geojensis]EWH11466.1 hypothetical protein KLA_15755 [Cellulophaga geojensis KL-A]
MFTIPDFNTITEEFERRNNIIKKHDKIPIKDPLYLEFICTYKSIELNADIELFEYDLCLRENKYIKENYNALSDKVWIIGRSGQGDEWFIDIKNNQILFYDHNKGEYERSLFANLEIDFVRFIQMGTVIKQMEKYIEEGEEVTEEYIKIMNTISPNLFNKYPYKY